MPRVEPHSGRPAPWPALLPVLLLLASGWLGGQHMGAISGRILDETGGVLPGVALTVRGDGLPPPGLTTISGPEGGYRLSLIAAGTYRVQASLDGFATRVAEDVRVRVNQTVTLDFVLPLARIAETLQVRAGIPLLEGDRSDVNSRVLGEAIEALPLNGRNVVDLIALVPGAKREPAAQQGEEISIFGERGAALSYIVDGGDNNHPLEGGAFQRFTQDSIREFEVITTGYQAEFGRAQGGIANIVTRSGSNLWAGSGFLFARNDSLDSSNVEGQEVPTLRRAQWGATVGGPLRRDRAFFFGSVEVTDETRGVNLDRSRIPGFALQGLGTPVGREDFGMGPETQGLAALVKVDLLPGQKDRLHFLFNRTTSDVGGEISSPVAGTVALPSAARTEDAGSSSGSLRHVWTLSPFTFLESSGKYIDGDSGQNREREERLEPVLLLLRSGFLQTNAPFGGKTDRQLSRLQLSQNLSHWQQGWGGSHLFKMGWDWSRVKLEGLDEVTNDVEYSAAFLDPDQAGVMGDLFERYGFEQAAARFFVLSGNPDGGLRLDLSNHDIALFLQDEWRVHPDLILNLGLRYDHASLFSRDRNNLAPRLGFAWDRGGTHGTVIRGSLGWFYDRNLLSAAATVPELGGVFQRRVFDVALPRLGAVYTDSLIDLVITSGFPQPEGSRGPAENPAYLPVAEALRSDPLSLYDLLGIQVADPGLPPVVTAGNLQQMSGLSVEQAIGRLEAAFPGTDWEFWDVPGGSVVGDRVLSFFPRGPLDLTRDVSRYSSARTPWTRAFNLGVEQQLSGEFALSASYVHRPSRDLLTRRIVNLFNVLPGDPSFGKTLDGGPRINQVTYQGRIDYDGLVLQLRKRFGGFYGLNLSYTLSRARDNLLTGAVGSGFTHNNRPELDRGPSNQSVPHLFSANAVVHLPWRIQLSTIGSWRTGNAFNPRGITDQDGDGLVDQRDISQGRNSFRTDPFFNVDLRVLKRFEVGEGQQLDLLLEAFNLSNQANVRNVNAVSGPSFGIPNNFFSGRELQVGVRYSFGRD